MLYAIIIYYLWKFLMAADIKERQKTALDAYKESTGSGGSIDKNRFNVKIFQ